MAVMLSAMFLTSVMGAWFFSSKTFQQENVKGQLRYDLQKAMEWLKEDIRLTNGSNILFYPADSASYTAISIPKATPNASGLYTLSSDLISWDSTVIYHLYTNGDSVELRRTVFDSYLSSSAARQSELDAVVAAGGSDSATTRVMASADDISFDITPTSPSFDGYASSLSLSENTSFGSKQMTAGNHLVRFTVQGKNAASSGYRIGFDQLAFSPSGGGQEAEVLTVSATSGAASVLEDMSSYGSDGLWHGNYQKEYQSAAVNAYIEYQIYYDRWLESNFSDVTHSYTEVYGNNPAVRIASRENQTLLSAWKADFQTGGSDADNAGFHDMTIRNIISASAISGGGQMVRFKFLASAASGPLVIHEAYFGARSATNLYDFAAVPTQLYFGNPTVASGETDGVGATGSTGSTAITIPQGSYVWSNWVAVTVTDPPASDYLVSVVNDSSAGNGNETIWDSGGTTSSYVLNGIATPTGTWAAAAYSANTAIHSLSDMALWSGSGTVTSQIYDTKMASPVFGNLTWTTNGSGAYTFRVRSSANEDMSGATAWAAATTYGSTPAALTTASARYVQWQCSMAAASPYSTYPEIDDVTITWPGQTAIVDVSGYFTKRPNYGTFTVQVDGADLVNALEVEMSATKEYQGEDYEATLAAEIKARNTGK